MGNYQYSGIEKHTIDVSGLIHTNRYLHHIITGNDSKKATELALNICQDIKSVINIDNVIILNNENCTEDTVYNTLIKAVNPTNYTCKTIIILDNVIVNKYQQEYIDLIIYNRQKYLFLYLIITLPNLPLINHQFNVYKSIFFYFVGNNPVENIIIKFPVKHHLQFIQYYNKYVIEMSKILVCTNVTNQYIYGDCYMLYNSIKHPELQPLTYCESKTYLIVGTKNTNKYDLIQKIIYQNEYLFFTDIVYFDSMTPDICILTYLNNYSNKKIILILHDKIHACSSVLYDAIMNIIENPHNMIIFITTQFVLLLKPKYRQYIETVIFTGDDYRYNTKQVWLSYLENKIKFNDYLTIVEENNNRNLSTVIDVKTRTLLCIDN